MLLSAHLQLTLSLTARAPSLCSPFRFQPHLLQSIPFHFHMTIIRKTKPIHHRRRTSTQLPLLNSNIDTQIYSVLPFFGFINLTISCGSTIYRACTNGDISMEAFVTFVFFATFLFYYLCELNHKIPPCDKPPKKHYLKVGIWVVPSVIMLGFAYQFSKFMSPAASISFFVIVIAGNTLLFYVYFVRDGDMSCSVFSSCEGKRRKARDNRRIRKPIRKEYRHITLTVENV